MTRSTPAPGGNASVILLTALLTAILTGALALWLNRPKPQPIAVHPPPAAGSRPGATAFAHRRNGRRLCQRRGAQPRQLYAAE